MNRSFPVLLPALALALSPLAGVWAQSASTATLTAQPPAPPLDAVLNQMPSPAEAAAFAKAEEETMIPDLEALRKIYAGEKLKDEKLSLSGFAFLEVLTASMMGPEGDPPKPQKSENPLRLEIYRIARKGLTDKFANMKDLRDHIFQISRYRNAFLKTAPAHALAYRWKEVLAEENASGQPNAPLRLEVTDELAARIAAVRSPGKDAKAAAVRFIDLQLKIAKAELPLLKAAAKAD